MLQLLFSDAEIHPESVVKVKMENFEGLDNLESINTNTGTNFKNIDDMLSGHVKNIVDQRAKEDHVM